MNLSIIIIAFGGAILFLPNAMWIGISFMGIGLVVYYMSKTEPPESMRAQMPYFQYMPQQRRAAPGVAWDVKDQYKEGMDQMRSELTGESQKGPHIKDGMFNLPVPMENEVGQFVDLNYRVPTKARGFTQERDKGGNPWLPGF
jgi:hypothetical protein